MIVADVLEPRLGPLVTGLGYELLGIERQQSRRGLLLRLYIDAEQGISLADCEKVSKHVNDVLAVDELITGDYLLEVSSPGLDRLLFKPAHFQKFVGANAQLKLRIPRHGQRNLHGRIVAADATQVQLNQADEVISLEYQAIERARLSPEWIQATPAKPGRQQRKQSG